MNRQNKPRLSFMQIWNTSFGFLGIQFGFALQNANVSRIFESLGASIDNIPILWLAAPVTGLIIQPIIGHLSDKTWNRLGRRKPFFLTGAILTSLALILMPNSPALWIAAGTLWIMDASINISMEPFRAFVGDMLPSEQRTLGFSMQSFFIGIGAVAGSALPYVLSNWAGVSNTPTGNEALPDTVRWSFYIGGAVLFGAVLVTILTTKEYAPEVLASFAEDATTTRDAVQESEIGTSKFRQFATYFALGGALIIGLVYFFGMDVQIYILGSLLLLIALFFYLVTFFRKRDTSNGLTEIMTDMMRMPRTMGQLAVVQFFTWIAFFAMWIYTTSGIAQNSFGTTDTTSKAYQDAGDWVGVMFMVYNGVSAITAFMLPMLAKKIGRRATHFIALVIGGIGLISMLFIKDQNMLLWPMVGVGLAWSSTLTMPYAILAGALPANKMGFYMGVFNFFVVIPQIVAAAILGFFVKSFFNEEAIYALVVGGVRMIIAGFLNFILKDMGDMVGE